MDTIHDSRSFYGFVSVRFSLPKQIMTSIMQINGKKGAARATHGSVLDLLTSIRRRNRQLVVSLSACAVYHSMRGSSTSDQKIVAAIYHTVRWGDSL